MTSDSDTPSTTKLRLRNEFPEGFDDLEMNALLQNLRESDALEAILKALEGGQDYDAGNGIVFLSQTGLLSRSGLTRIADLVLDDLSLFQSKIGAMLYSKICRSVGMWMLNNGETERGSELLKRGLLRSLWRVSPGGRLKGWSDCRYRDQFPKHIEVTIRKIEAAVTGDDPNR
jgi:hypothetical protein